MDTESTLLQAISADPGDDTAWLALADVLEDNGQTDRAELVRLREQLRRLDPDASERPLLQDRLQHLLLEGVQPAIPRRSVLLPSGLSLELVLIPPGSFWMGSPLDEPDRYSDEGPRGRVSLTHGFWLAVTPITQEQWAALTSPILLVVDAPGNPAQAVSWGECQELCRALRRHTGQSFRLPTEAEWEYACRATTTSAFYLGSDEAALHRAGWYSENTGSSTEPVGGKVPNAWGLRDMHGNVKEWCQDCEREYSEQECIDPCEDRDGPRVVRGGSWYNRSGMCRAAFRYSLTPGAEDAGVGVRVASNLD